jgi:hypothetical protein
MGFGRGRGFGGGGWCQGRAFGRGGWMRFGGYTAPGPYLAPDSDVEKQALASQAKALQSELEWIHKRLADIESKASTDAS